MDVSTSLNRLATSTARRQDAASLQLGSENARPGLAAGQSGATTGQSDSVRISGSGQALYASNRARPASGKNDDIDSSSLPDEIKEVLKMIREIKARLREQQQALVEIMADQSLGDEERKARLAAIQTTIGSLSGALVSATMMLNKLMGTMNLDDTQKAEVMSLMTK